MKPPALLPCPRSLKLKPGIFILPACATLHLDNPLKSDEARAIAKRLQSAAIEIGVEILLPRSSRRKEAHSQIRNPKSEIRISQSPSRSAGSAATDKKEGYTLTIDNSGVLIEFCEVGGLRAAVATLRQLLREYGRRLPCLNIRDWPDFARRGVMLDISRGRVPRLETLLDLVDHLADFKINELQLYTEHTFAYRKYKSVWSDWGALTGAETRKLDTRCRELGIDLVPNQNSFGHLRYFLEHPRLKHLAEVSKPYEDESGEFIRRPSTLAPNHPGALPFLRGLYDKLLPNFSGGARSRRREEVEMASDPKTPPPRVGGYFNVGCDETWDLGLGQSKALCARLGKGRVYLDFLKKIHGEISKRGKRMMFWGDIILKYPNLIPALASFGAPASGTARSKSSVLRAVPEAGAPNLIALNWGYEANHPFEREATLFSKSRIPFYVCPGTSTWMTLIGRHDNAFANLRAAAKSGRKHGAIGYLITDWGDGGHPQPLAVSWLPYLLGASVGWCAASFDEKKLVPVLSRDVFHDPTQRVAKATLELGFAHRKLGYFEPNSTPLGTVIAAPTPESRELFCRNGLKCYARIPGTNIRATLATIEKQSAAIAKAKPSTRAGRILQLELVLAARMAAGSCKLMLWQQALAAGRNAEARRIANDGIRELRKLEREFNAYWPLRNKGTTAKCSPFLRWRMNDYRRGVLHCPQDAAGVVRR